MKTKHTLLACMPMAMLFFISGTNPTSSSMKDPKGYAFVPMGSYKEKGKVISVQAFYIKKTEVTDKEYREFLNDLKTRENKNEYKIALPDTNQWKKVPGIGTSMREFYFSHPAYDNYPVVNITRAGAMLYCKWLTEKFNKKLKNIGYYGQVRLPLQDEWIIAAMAGDTAAVYPWKGNETVNKKGEYYCNFNHSNTDNKINKSSKGSTLYAPVVVKHYKPNAYGIYDMAGNVAEMVTIDTNYRYFKTKGGSFNDNEKYIKIKGDDPYDGISDASPFIGFRPLMTYIGKMK